MFQSSPVNYGEQYPDTYPPSYANTWAMPIDSYNRQVPPFRKKLRANDQKQSMQQRPASSITLESVEPTSNKGFK